MSLYWLCYRHNNQISVVIEPGASLVHARLRASLAGSRGGSGRKGYRPRGRVRAVDLTEENVDSLIEVAIEDA